MEVGHMMQRGRAFSESLGFICHLHWNLKVDLSQWLSWLNNRQQHEAKLWESGNTRWGGGGEGRGREKEKEILRHFQAKGILPAPGGAEDHISLSSYLFHSPLSGLAVSSVVAVGHL